MIYKGMKVLTIIIQVLKISFKSLDQV